MKNCLVMLVAGVMLVFRIVGLGGQQAVPDRTSVEGTVVDARTGEPLSGVAVLGPPEPGAPFRDISTRAGATTARGGQFLLEGLPSGRALEFRKPGYVPRSINYPFVAGRRTSGVVVRMEATGVLSGRIFDGAGRPAVKISVTAFGFVYASGFSELKIRGETLSDDRGEFRFTELQPDRYLLNFQPESAQVFGFQPSRREPALLYPGVNSISKSEFVEVKSGRETRIKDVIFATTAPLGEVRVHLVNGGGEAKAVALWLLKATRSQRIIDGEFRGSTPLRPEVDARFCDENSRPPCIVGSLKIQFEPGARIDKTYWPTAPGAYEVGAQWMGADGVGRQIVEAFDFQGGDREISLVLEEPDGRLELRSVLEEPVGTIRTIAEAPGMLLCRSQSGCLGPTQGLSMLRGEGKLDGLSPGRYHIVSVFGPPNTYVVSVRQNDNDALVEGVLVSKNPAPIEMRFRPGTPMFAGQVIDAQGRAVADAIVGILPEAPLDATRLRGLRTIVRTGSDGQFELSGILPGRYRAYAWASANENVFADPTFATTFKEKGTPVTVQGNGQVPVRLTVLD